MSASGAPLFLSSSIVLLMRLFTYLWLSSLSIILFLMEFNSVIFCPRVSNFPSLIELILNCFDISLFIVSWFSYVTFSKLSIFTFWAPVVGLNLESYSSMTLFSSLHCLLFLCRPSLRLNSKSLVSVFTWLWSYFIWFCYSFIVSVVLFSIYLMSYSCMVYIIFFMLRLVLFMMCCSTLLS